MASAALAPISSSSVSSADPPKPPFSPTHYRKYAQRFSILSLYGLSNAMNAIVWITFSPIISFIQTRYDVGAFAANGLSLVFMALYAPGTLLSVWLMERYGLRVCLITGAAMNLVSCWIRYASVFVSDPHGAFGVLMLGQCIGGIAQPIFTNLPSRIAGDWFPVSERDLGTVVGAMSNPVGNAIGSVVPSLVVSAVGDIPALLLGESIASTVLAVLVVLFVKDRPPSPPSAGAEIKWLAAEKQQHHPLPLSNNGSSGEPPLSPTVREAALVASQLPLLAEEDSCFDRAHADGKSHEGRDAVTRVLLDFKQLLKNRNYLRLLVAFGVGLGIFNALLTLLEQILKPCGYNSDTAGIAGGALLGAGLVAAVIIGVVLEKTKAYVPLLKFGIFACVASTVFMLASLQKGVEGMTLASWGVMGFTLIPLLPVSLENAAEATYPIPEDNSAGLLLLAGQLFGIVFIFLLTYLLGQPPSSDCSSVATPFAGVILGCLLVAAGVLFTFKKDYRRKAAEDRLDARTHELPSTATATTAASSH